MVCTKSSLELDTQLWAEETFGQCDLGDKRRTRRLVQVAAQAADDPGAKTPKQSGDWADAKAAYRLFDNDAVHFDAICEPHWQQTRQQAVTIDGAVTCDGAATRQDAATGDNAETSHSTETILILGDTTEIDFGKFRAIEGLAQTGRGSGRGFHVHSALMVRVDDREPNTDGEISSADSEILGMAGAKLFHRVDAPKKETMRQRQRRERESQIWKQVVERVGRPPENTRWLHVFDTGADDYETFVSLLDSGCGWLVRASHKNRWLLDSTGEKRKLLDIVQNEPLAGTYELKVNAQQRRKHRPPQPGRVAQLEVRYASVSMPMPTQPSPAIKARGVEPIPMCVVEVREVNAPEGVAQPLHWVLLTSEDVTSFDDAWRVIGYYEKRPLIEEFHKCIKTGCQLESRQFRTSDRLERVCGLMCMVALRLLQLRSVARTEPDRPAEDVVPTPWIIALESIAKKNRPPIKTVGEFFRRLAMLGGFLGRKGDGEPGWQTIWRGLEKLLDGLKFLAAMQEKCG